jgi:hypothetical protein
VIGVGTQAYTFKFDFMSASTEEALVGVAAGAPRPYFCASVILVEMTSLAWATPSADPINVNVLTAFHKPNKRLITAVTRC